MVEYIKERHLRKVRLERAMERLESEICSLSKGIDNTWMILIGPGCGHFKDWNVVNGDMVVQYVGRGGGDVGTDTIPIRFFTGPIEEAKEAYTEYIRAKSVEKEEKRKQEEEKKERGLLKKLTKKYS